MGHELKHGGSQTLVDEVAGQAALTGHKRDTQLKFLSHTLPRILKEMEWTTDAHR